MLIWVVLIVGAGVAFLGWRLGVFTMFAAVFNLLLSIHISVLSTPLIVRSTPDLEMGYYAAFSLLLMTIFLFALLQGFTWYFFLRGQDILFPELFDKVGGAGLGFAAGYAALGVLVLGFCMMPISRADYAKGVLPVASLDRFGADTAQRVCNFMASCSLECLDGAAEETTEYLIGLSTSEEPAPAAPTPAEVPEGAGASAVSESIL